TLLEPPFTQLPQGRICLNQFHEAQKDRARLGKLAFFQQDQAQRAVPVGVVGVELGSRAELGDGSVQVLPVVKDKAQVAASGSSFGSKFDDLAVVGEGPFQIL